jgi:multisite-specific tRNA:(cytosine-C5)-methyltransferase
MIPPLLMDVRPGMTVLDLCAAPGSKAAQLIEMVHSGEEVRMRRISAKLKRQEDRELSAQEEGTEEDLEGEEESDDWKDGGRATGLLIANDADYKRAHLLIHQMKRLNSPNLIVTNHDATLFPSIKLKIEPGPNGFAPRGRYLKFDRILADVPCSGDGTCRKNVNVWKDWNPGNALGLFATQVRILVRGLQMLTVGGRVVYSTCSMNPVENEAVIAAAIARCGGSSFVNVLDCGNALPELKRRPGLSKWNVVDRQGKIWQTWSEVEDERARKGPDGLGRLVEEMFPPSDPSTLPFERCMRVYPHLQDTGAFFIVVLEKKSEIKGRTEAENKKPEPKTSSILDAVAEIEAKPANDTNPIGKIDSLDSIMPASINGDADSVSAAARQNREVAAASGGITAQKRELDTKADAEMATKRLKIREEFDEPAPQGAEDREVHWPPPPAAQLDIILPETVVFRLSPVVVTSRNPVPKAKPVFEEPFKYLSPNHPELRSIYEFYQLSPRFPRDRFMVRNASGNPVRTIYYTSTLTRDILIENEGRGIKFVHCGVKMFVSQDVQKEGVCPWRIQTEGLPMLEGWVGEERVVRLSNRETLRKLLVEMFPKVDGDGWKELGEIGERVRDIGMGCCVLRVETSDEEGGFR